MMIGVPWRWFEEEALCTPETRAAFDAALAVFRDLGATIRAVEPPPMQLFNDAKKIIAIAELYSIHEKDLKTRPELFGASLRYRIIAGSLVRAEDYVQAMRVRRDLAMAMQQIFTTIDLMMLPTGEPAGKLEPVPHYSLFTDPSYTTAFNVSGNPALSVCSGYAANGMPQSLQIVGRLQWPAFPAQWRRDGRPGGQRACNRGAVDRGDFSDADGGHLLHDIHRQREKHWSGRRRAAVMEGTADQNRELVCVLHLLRPFDRRPRYTDEIPEQKTVGDGVPRVLLAGGHDQRRSGHAGIEQAAEAMAEPAGGVKIDKAGPARRLRIAVGHRHHARLLQAPDVTDVGGIGSGRCMRRPLSILPIAFLVSTVTPAAVSAPRALPSHSR
jgi:hypothetical protein